LPPAAGPPDAAGSPQRFSVKKSIKMHQVITDSQRAMAGLWAQSMALFVTDVVPEMFA